MLVLNNLGKIYPNGVNALERFSAEIRLGEIAAIIGGSGCGKSTLLRAIAGLDGATFGTVTLDETSRFRGHTPRLVSSFRSHGFCPGSVSPTISVLVSPSCLPIFVARRWPAHWRASASPIKPTRGRANCPAGR